MIRWTSPEKAKKRIKRKTVTAREFNQAIRDYYNVRILDWTGHIGRSLLVEPSCGCRACQHARFDMGV